MAVCRELCKQVEGWLPSLTIQYERSPQYFGLVVGCPCSLPGLLAKPVLRPANRPVYKQTNLPGRLELYSYQTIQQTSVRPLSQVWLV